MKRCKNCALILLLVLFVFSPVSCQDAKAEDEDTIDLSTPEDAEPEKTEDNSDAGPIVGQSLLPPLPPLLGQSLMPGPLNLFGGVFPALNSLLLWSNMFPIQALLGQSLLGQPQQGSIDQSPSASKVVLVLAEDRDPHAAMKAANQAAARTIRQNDMLSQFLAQISQADVGQMLAQALPMQQQNPGQMLQQMFPSDLSQSMNQMLSQMLQPLPGLDLSQIPLLGQALGQAALGQAAPAAEPIVGQAAEGESESAAAAEAAADAAGPATQPFPFSNIQQAIDAGTQMLGQALQQQNGDFNSAFQLPTMQQAFDAGSQMLGQALQQASADPSSGNLPFPNIQAMIDSGTQMLTQGGGIFNLRPMQSLDAAAAASDAEPAASDISEVRVKPDIMPTTVQHPSQQQMPTAAQNPTPYQMPTPTNMDELKVMTALHKALVQKKLPILWFRTSTDHTAGKDLKHTEADMKPKSVEELQMDSKLQAFQQQLIRELRLLQDIERQAKEMRAASKGATAKTFKDATGQYANTLSKIPVHKITRGDIEKAMTDEYVRKLLQKVAIGQMKERMAFHRMQQPESTLMKRQAMQSTPTMMPRQMSREDIIRLLAYAYRIANANGLRTFETSGATKSSTGNDGKARDSFKDNTKAMERQMIFPDKKCMNEGTQMTQKQQTMGQSPKMMPEGRQFMNGGTQRTQAQQTMGPSPKMMPEGRQWINDGTQMTQQTMGQSPKMMPEGRQFMIDGPQMTQAQQTMGQSANMMSEGRQWMNEGTKMAQERQMMFPDKKCMNKGTQMTQKQQPMEQSPKMMPEGRQVMNDGTQMTQAQQTMGQSPKMMPEGRQWMNDGTQMTQAQQTVGQSPKMMPEGRQFMNDGTQMTQAQQTMGQSPKMMPEGRQMIQKMREIMARQWASDPNAPKTTTNMGRQSMEQQMPMPYAQSFREDPTMMPQSRQMTTDKVQANPQMAMQQQTQQPQQQQQIDTQTEGVPKENKPTCAAITTTAEGRQWADQQSQNAMQQAQMMMQQEQQKQQQNAMQQTSQMARQQQDPATMQQSTQKDMQQPQKTMPETQMDMQQPRAQDMQQMIPNMHEPLLLVGAATPQMPETTGKARQKDDGWGDGRGGGWGGWGSGWGGPGWGGSWGGWGGWGGDGWSGGWGGGWGGGWDGGWDDGKKGGKYGKHFGWPTVVNYYYNPGGHGYHRGHHGHDYAGSSDAGYDTGSSHNTNYKKNYGNSKSGGSNYGSSNYGSSNYGGSSTGSAYPALSGTAYRTAVGDEEIQAMLEEHSRQKMTTGTDCNPTTKAAFEPLPITHPHPARTTTTTSDESSDQKTDELEKKEKETLMDDDSNQKSKTTTKTTMEETATTKTKANTKTTNSDATFRNADTPESERLDCSVRLRDMLNVGNVGKFLKKTSKCIRIKRNADYGTLQPIDEASLEELRKTYKNSLKEITLKPDEDPTEALMRYNAASIREALEHANEEPIEVNTAEGHCEHGAQVTILNPHETNTYTHHQHDGHHKAMGTPHVHTAHYHLQQAKPQANQKQDDPVSTKDRKATINAAIDATQISLCTKVAASDEARSIISNLPESELQAVMELIKQQMQACCDACRDRILSNIKTNIQTANESETTTKSTATKNEPIDDAEFEKWLHDMELKGYDAKYLTKSHYWEYLNSGKLTLTVEESVEDAAATQAQTDNKIAKKSHESSQNVKRFTQKNSWPPKGGDESKTQNKKVDISKSAKGKAFEKQMPSLNHAVRGHAHVVNDELQHLKAHTEQEETEQAPSPYALRGKFKHSKKRQTDATPPLSRPVKFNALTTETTTPSHNSYKNSVDTNAGKAVELLSLLYDLGPTVQTENGKPTQLSVMVMPFVGGASTMQPEQANLTNITNVTTSRTRTKRLRLRRKKVEHVDEAASTV